MGDELVRTIEVTTHGRFLIDVPDSSPPHRVLVGFHGYGENAERNLEQLRRIPGASAYLLVAIQALNRFYGPKMEEIVASWMTRQDREQAIADNIEYVKRVLAQVTAQYGTSRLVFVGFSQGVAMAFRAAARCGHTASGLVALGGDLPPDVRDLPAESFPPMLVATGTRDPWYTPDRLQADVTHLQSIGVNVQSLVFNGGHEWTDEFRAAAGAFLQVLKPDKP